MLKLTTGYFFARYSAIRFLNWEEKSYECVAAKYFMNSVDKAIISGLLSNDKENLIESGICPAQRPKFSLIFSLIALV